MEEKLYSCYKCKTKKTKEHFSANKSRSSGLSSMCKLCKCEHNRIKRGSNPNRIRKNASTEENKRFKKQLSNKKYEQTNLKRRLSKALRRRLKKTVNRYKGNFKLGKSIDWLGCSGADLIKHIESTWKEGMSWDNYGWGRDKWVIDHKRPIIDFIRSNEDPKKANHYTNLQALWFDENTIKADKF